jgi:hypothetical protein
MVTDVTSVKAQRKRFHDALRRLAGKTVTLLSEILATERALGFPGTPFRETLGVVEEYYNQLADEFDDNPDEKKPMQSFEDAVAKAVRLNRDTCEAEHRESLQRRLRKAPKKGGKLRNAGPNGDSAGDLLGDAIGMLRNLSTYSGDPEGLRKRVEEVVGVLRELEVTQAA